MLRKIEHLRTQPKPVRERTALFFAFVVTAVVVTFWGLSLSTKIGETPDFVDNIDDESGGFSRAMDDVGVQFAAVFDIFEDVFDEVSSTTATSTVPAATTSDTFDLEAIFGTSSRPVQPEPQPVATTTNSDVGATSSTVAEPLSGADQPSNVILIGTTSFSGASGE